MKRWPAILFLLLVANSIYLFGFPAPTVFYMANVLLHVALGLALSVVALRLLWRYPVPACCFLAAGVFGLYLAVWGNTTPHRWALVCHAIAGFAAVFIVVSRIPSAKLRLSAAAIVV